MPPAQHTKTVIRRQHLRVHNNFLMNFLMLYRENVFSPVNVKLPDDKKRNNVMLCN